MKKLDLSSHLDEGPKNACFAICSPSGSEQLLLQCRIFVLLCTLSPLKHLSFSELSNRGVDVVKKVLHWAATANTIFNF